MKTKPRRKWRTAAGPLIVGAVAAMALFAKTVLLHAEDEVEIKLLANPGQLGDAKEKFGLNGKAPNIHSVAFFDTKDLDLINQKFSPDGKEVSLILRIRAKDGKKWESTVKLRSEKELDGKYQSDESNHAKREGDWVIGAKEKSVESYSIEHEEKDQNNPLQAALDEKKDKKVEVKKAFKKHQEDLVAENTNSKFDWDHLKRFGPVDNIEIWKDQKVDGLTYPITIEHWELPKREGRVPRTLLEYSIKVPRAKAKDASKDFKEFLAKKQLGEDSTGETKTRAVLNHFKD